MYVQTITLIIIFIYGCNTHFLLCSSTLHNWLAIYQCNNKLLRNVLQFIYNNNWFQARNGLFNGQDFLETEFLYCLMVFHEFSSSYLMLIAISHWPLLWRYIITRFQSSWVNNAIVIQLCVCTDNRVTSRFLNLLTMSIVLVCVSNTLPCKNHAIIRVFSTQREFIRLKE